MEQSKYIKGGEIIAIPLFLGNNEKGRIRKGDERKQFAFARAINEESGKILIEIFNKTGSLDTNVVEILNSGRLMKPLYTIWTGVERKRWKVVKEDPNYDKERDSKYSNIQLVLGGIDNLRIWHAKDKTETPITKEELINGNYQLMAIYDYTQIEGKILDKINR